VNPTVAKIIDELCTEIETLIREGSTPVTSPTCKAAREYLKDHGFGHPKHNEGPSGTIPRGVEH
jgi:hypothetical protein